MATPADAKLYNETKKEVDKIYDKPSAYRSMAYTRFYLRAFRDKYGEKKNPYTGKKPGDLEKWRREKWIDIRSFLDTPKDPQPCGNVEYGKKEYPLCMPLSKAKSYSKEELEALLYRKSELGKKRLVKEPFLRDLYGKPIQEVNAEDIKPLKPVRLPEKPMKEPKMKEPKEMKIREPKAPRERKVKLPREKPVVQEAEVVEEAVVVPKRKPGRPRREKTEEQLKAIAEKERQKALREERKAQRLLRPKRVRKERTEEAPKRERRIDNPYGETPLTEEGFTLTF